MRPFWSPVKMEICIRMPQPKNWRRRHLQLIERIWKKELAYECPSSRKISFKSKFFLSKSDHFFSYWYLYFKPLLGWECAYVCHNLRAIKEEFYENSKNIKEVIGIQGIFILEIKHQKYIFYQNLTIFSATCASILNSNRSGDMHSHVTT